MSEPKRQRRLTHFFDRRFGRHYVFVYNDNNEKVAEISITPEGRIVVAHGVIANCDANKAKWEA